MFMKSKSNIKLVYLKALIMVSKGTINSESYNNKITLKVSTIKYNYQLISKEINTFQDLSISVISLRRKEYPIIL